MRKYTALLAINALILCALSANALYSIAASCSSAGRCTDAVGPATWAMAVLPIVVILGVGIAVLPKVLRGLKAEGAARTERRSQAAEATSAEHSDAGMEDAMASRLNRISRAPHGASKAPFAEGIADLAHFAEDEAAAEAGAEAEADVDLADDWAADDITPLTSDWQATDGASDAEADTETVAETAADSAYAAEFDDAPFAVDAVADHADTADVGVDLDDADGEMLPPGAAQEFAAETFAVEAFGPMPFETGKSDALPPPPDLILAVDNDGFADGEYDGEGNAQSTSASPLLHHGAIWAWLVDDSRVAQLLPAAQTGFPWVAAVVDELACSACDLASAEELSSFAAEAAAWQAIASELHATQPIAGPDAESFVGWVNDLAVHCHLIGAGLTVATLLDRTMARLDSRCADDEDLAALLDSIFGLGDSGEERRISAV